MTNFVVNVQMFSLNSFSALLLPVVCSHDESGALEQYGNKDTQEPTHRLHLTTRYWLLLQTSREEEGLLHVIRSNHMIF